MGFGPLRCLTDHWGNSPLDHSRVSGDSTYRFADSFERPYRVVSIVPIAVSI